MAEVEATQPYCDLWELTDQNIILEHIFRHMERRSYLKTHFFLTEFFTLSVELY